MMNYNTQNDKEDIVHIPLKKSKTSKFKTAEKITRPTVGFQDCQIILENSESEYKTPQAKSLLKMTDGQILGNLVLQDSGSIRNRANSSDDKVTTGRRTEPSPRIFKNEVIAEVDEISDVIDEPGFKALSDIPDEERDS